jgi:glycosyltransferase involved in cell wall biosynthesis
VVVNAARIQPAFAALTGFDGERVVVIPNGVRMPDRVMTRDEARAALGLPTSEKVVGAVARLDVQKRLDRLLRAVAILGNEVHCVIAGDGPERTALATLAEALGIASRVHFLGQRDDPWTVYAVMDVMVVSSDREGMSNSMLEALATGVPVVSTPVSGAEEALAPFPDGSCPGVLLRGFDEQELAAELRALLHDPVALRRMGAAARNRAASEFDFDRMLDRWVAVLAGRDRSAAFSRPAA